MTTVARREARAANIMRLRRLGIDTYQEPVVYMSADCPVCRSEGWRAQTRLVVSHGRHSIIATLNVTTGNLLGPDEASLSNVALALLGAREGDEVTLSHPAPLESLSHVRAKVYNQRLDDAAMHAVIEDIAAGRYSAVHLAAFITACAGGRLEIQEVVALTRAMADVGDLLEWGHAPIVDKHSVGGLPGNRTTMIVVPIVAAYGLTMPKTSSRAITSPSGTADAMETIAPVTLDLPAVRRVVEREGGCIAWGGAVRLSPADDIIIRVERPLDIDSDGQLVASVLSKKLAAGSTHVIIDIPVGPTAKVRSPQAAASLGMLLSRVGRAVGLEIRLSESDGMQPVGRGIGPALEARDVLAVLRREPSAAVDLRDRAVHLAGQILEMAAGVPAGMGSRVASEILDDGRAWAKLQAICDAQGGMREPPRAAFTRTVEARQSGRVQIIDNRRLGRVAKLSGAPAAREAGLELHAPLGTRVEVGQPLYTVHAAAPGELAYALAYAEDNTDIVAIAEDS
jgi:thymidine phosphorylase